VARSGACVLNRLSVRAVGKLFVLPAGALPLPASDSYIGLHRAHTSLVFLRETQIYCWPKQFNCRPRTTYAAVHRASSSLGARGD
jgi:hypothetical protein